ncbi:hypothetical protein LCL86_06080 [Muricauda ruestringensis]|uniref:tetratricopeptide repeat protein n=1 Tax=Flagellimonas ruestringensis TaxID=111501 RepID=UPI001CD6085F|nr:hypothetical protein [Allomuricauda ruestringensis]MCA0958601.1 hypothetical protein [Allomuricauda ruestringensis]
MKKAFLLWVVLVVFISTQGIAIAQEEQESAEVYLDEYTDEFQENFFEALKQKGIQNYDRAVDLFLKCKQLEPDNSVVDYELAKAYLLDKKYIQAQDYAVAALLSKPEDYWYLDNLLTILDKQGSPIEGIKQRIPYQNEKLRQNMAVSLFRMKKYEEASNVLGSMENSGLKTELTRKINDSLEKGGQMQKVRTVEQRKNGNDPVLQLQATMEQLISASNFKKLLSESQEALDTYPLQPYFYYAYGTALNNTGNASKGVEVLLSGLDYLLDDNQLQNKIYKQLSEGYTKIGDTQKANEYLNKINSGL